MATYRVEHDDEGSGKWLVVMPTYKDGTVDVISEHDTEAEARKATAEYLADDRANASAERHYNAQLDYAAGNRD